MFVGILDDDISSIKNLESQCASAGMQPRPQQLLEKHNCKTIPANARVTLISHHTCLVLGMGSDVACPCYVCFRQQASKDTTIMSTLKDYYQKGEQSWIQMQDGWPDGSTQRFFQCLCVKAQMQLTEVHNSDQHFLEYASSYVAAHSLTGCVLGH